MTKDFLLEMAAAYGVQDELAELLKDKPEPKVPMNLKCLLAEWRKERCMKRVEVLRRVDISSSQLAFYERGQQLNPGVRTLGKLAQGYQMPLWLLLRVMLSEAGVISAPGAGKAVRKRKRR
ncbi:MULTISPECIES: helix-turn-helix domain-containing protein [Leisingera]|jgi:hypothetical protein|uniref:helix-turn-helix domain-containing protein n=1 Tax=Leisingera TaxID=191028 RepID=UPI001151875E|nr:MULTISPECIES: helix-turn-helix transcriptional regulator [Leisingera]QDI74684.1 helix-turn-helix transcriptional regulator [Leisingera aquaemixtae]